MTLAMTPTTTTVPTFTQTHSAQNPVNIELLNFVAQRGHASWLELFAAFGDGELSSKSATQRFSKKLEYLVYIEKLQASGRGTTRSFSLSPNAGQPTPGRGRTTTHAGQADGGHAALLPMAQPVAPGSYCGQLVPPRQYNTMAAAPYVPPPQTAMRPGSLDYQRYTSHGDQC